MVINPTSIVLPGKLDSLTAAFKNNDNIDMVIGSELTITMVNGN